MDSAGKNMKDLNSWKETKGSPEVGMMWKGGTRKRRWEEVLAVNIACLCHKVREKMKNQMEVSLRRMGVQWKV